MGTINQFSFGGQSYSVSCTSPSSGSPCLVDTGTPIIFVPGNVYSAISGGQTGSLTLQLAGPDGAITLSFDAETLAKNQSSHHTKEVLTSWACPCGPSITLC